MDKQHRQWDGGQHPDGLAEGLGENSLGNPEFVSELMAQFAGEIQAICKRGESGELDTAEVEREMQEASRRMSAIFTGKTKGYRVTTWNTARLGGLESKARGFLASLKVHYGHDYWFDNSDPVAGLFFSLAHQVVSAYMAARNGATEHHLPNAMQRVIGMLMGYPDKPV